MIDAEQLAITEANRLAALLEAAAKGLKHRRHQKHIGPARVAIKAVMASYFARQEKALLAELRPKIKRELEIMPPLKEAISPQGKQFAKFVLPTSLHPLTFEASKSEVSDWNDAITAAIDGAARTIAKELGTTPGESIAGRYLADNSLSKLTGNLASTSVERLQDALATAWDAGGDFNAMVKAVTDTFEDFSTTRAQMIAQTEANDAYNYGRNQTARDAGMSEKAWETESGDPCQICLDNEADGWIDIDDTFSSGDSEPTAHPNCECTLNFRSGAEEEAA